MLSKGQKNTPMASSVTKVGPKYQVTIPKAARDALGIGVGDFVEATVHKDGILLRPKAPTDKDPDIERDIQEGLDDLEAGRVVGPFQSVREFKRNLKKKR